jgi:adenylyltransferase/sulfurtransferase
LGLSSHNLYELARAYAYHPSYLAMGPIFETQSKHLDYPPIGLEKLRFIASLCPLPLVAIGGIPYSQIPEILNLGCSGVAFIHSAKDLKEDGRFDRHFSLPDFNTASQEKLKQAKIVCVGTGGLAAGFLPYLAAAGLGQITLIDFDTISYSNLQRQVIFKESEIGQLKVEVAKRFLSELNAQIDIKAINQKIVASNARELLAGYDLILDGTDNFDAHYLINDAARVLKTDLISASVFQDQGQLFYLAADSACYRCIFPEAPPVNERPSCNIAGVLGTTPGIMGMMQAQLTVEVLTEYQGRIGRDTGLIFAPTTPLQSFCRTVNMKTWQVKNLQLAIAKDCPNCQTETSSDLIWRQHMSQEFPEMTVEELKRALDAGETVHLLDVREDDERAEFNMGGAHIPIQELPERINELNDKLHYIVYCARGGRSAMACQFLAAQGFKVTNLAGGAKGYQNL